MTHFGGSHGWRTVLLFFIFFIFFILSLQSEVFIFSRFAVEMLSEGNAMKPKFSTIHKHFTTHR